MITNMELPSSLIPPLYPKECEVSRTTDVVNPPVEDDSMVVTVGNDDVESDSLLNYNLKELRAMCKQRGLKADGKKTDLIARLS
tara:strand:- start:870 stop:1121 length:252 start_codon:yes stop_codon:yes gene_type:complete